MTVACEDKRISAHKEIFHENQVTVAETTDLDDTIYEVVEWSFQTPTRKTELEFSDDEGDHEVTFNLKILFHN